MPRTVIVAYRPKPGQEAALQDVVARHVPVLQACGLATAMPAVTMQAADGTIVEVFQWASAEAVKQAHHEPAVQALWDEFGRACDFVPLKDLAEAAQMFAEFEPLGAWQ